MQMKNFIQKNVKGKKMKWKAATERLQVLAESLSWDLDKNIEKCLSKPS